MHPLKRENGNRRLLPLSLLLLLFATLLTAGAAFAGLRADSPSSLVKQGNTFAQGTPTPTPVLPTATATTCTSAGTPGPWTFRANFPDVRYGEAVASDGTTLYAFGGRNTGRLGDAYKYNYTTNSWTPIAYIGDSSFNYRAEYGHNGKIYLIGGASNEYRNRIYDIASNTWSYGAQPPGALTSYGSAYWSGKIYTIGGAGTSGYTNAAYAYDIASDTWSTLAPLPQAEHGMAAGAINGKIYVANGSPGQNLLTNNLYIYDIASNTWSEGPPSPLASSYPADAVIGGKLYMIGGGTPAVTANTYLYDPVTNSWSQGPSLNVARRWSEAATINTPGGQTAIVVGGWGDGITWLSSVEASTAPVLSCTPTATGTPPPNTPTRTATLTRTATVGSTAVGIVTATSTCISGGTPGPWAYRANYPEPMFGLAVASDGTYVYGFAGRNVSRQYTAYKYNYAINSWTRIADVPAASGTGSQADYGYNGKIYVTGGSTSQSANRIYDIATNSWSFGAPVPAEVAEHGHAYWNGKVYVIGGGPYGAPGNAVYAYDIAANTWSTLAPLPQAEWGMASAAINGKIYVANGYTGQYTVTNNLYIYDIATNTWSEGPPSPLASGHAASTVIGGKLYMIGGSDCGTACRNTYLYNPVTNSWSVGPMLNVARGWSGAATINTPDGQTAIVVSGDMTNASVEASTAPLVPCATATATPLTNTPTSTRTATAGATNTVAQPSNTAVASRTSIPPTNTVVAASATPTPCTISFTDVPPGSTFYPYIRCLACRGIVSGYNDGTFLPDNPVTRGQLSKIVSGAAAFTEDPGPQMFEDVPSGHPFYVWINRLARRGIMGGYECGGPGEPCISGMPYFRPSNSATRGQTSKIVAGAAYINQEPSGQTFEDVPPGHTFYRWIEQLASRGVMGGYECGGPGEPCVPPLDRPYFRPGNNVTRGQASKIVANTFFPGCVTPFR